MGVINNNTGPVSAETSVLPASEFACLNNIWLQLKVITSILEQAYGIQDSNAAIRNSMTVTDLTNIS